MDELPPTFSCYVPESFAAFTLAGRLPGILADCWAALHGDAPMAPAWTGFMQTMIEGGPIPADAFAAVGGWPALMAPLVGRLWRDTDYFLLEFLFYHWINSQAGFFTRGIDVFAARRRAALSHDIGLFENAYARLDADGQGGNLAALLPLATEGNVADLSQLALLEAHGDTQTQRLVDDSPALLGAAAPAQGSLHLIADNFGIELLWDLALIAAVLDRPGWRATLHLKPWPMFVSDALIADAQASIAALVDPARGAAVQALGERLDAACKAGRLAFRAADDWGEARHFRDLSPALRQELAAADLVIAKGDLNYRRIVEDRTWPNDLPTGDIAPRLAFDVTALRVMKSEAVLGLPLASISALDRADPHWRFNGRYSMVQRFARRPHDGERGL